MDKEKICNGDCLGCSFQQQVYCAAQHGHALLENQRSIIERLDALMRAFMPSEIINPLKKEEPKEEEPREDVPEITE